MALAASGKGISFTLATRAPGVGDVDQPGIGLPRSDLAQDIGDR